VIAKERFYTIAFRFWLLASIALVLGWFFRDFLLAQTSLCLFKSVSGIECPSCGSTRSVLAFLSGEIWLSLRYNLLGFLFGVLMLALPLLWFVEKVFKRVLIYALYVWLSIKFKRRRFLWFAVVLVVIYWIYFYSTNVKFLHGVDSFLGY
jgi:hypothetical protein